MMINSNRNRAIAGTLVSALLLSLSTPCFADFQYTETTKITGGAAVGAMKFAGVFSKDARQATQGTTSTISFKGNKMSREDSLGQIEIIDLDARSITQIDTKKKTYSTMTFDEMRAAWKKPAKKPRSSRPSTTRNRQPGEDHSQSHDHPGHRIEKIARLHRQRNESPRGHGDDLRRSQGQRPDREHVGRFRCLDRSGKGL